MPHQSARPKSVVILFAFCLLLTFSGTALPVSADFLVDSTPLETYHSALNSSNYEATFVSKTSGTIFVSQEGESPEVFIIYRNTGSSNWPSSTGLYVRDVSGDSGSVFRCSSWPGSNRVASVGSVSPSQIKIVRFKLCGNNQSERTYQLGFQLAEGELQPWIDGPNAHVSFSVRVVNYKATFVSQSSSTISVAQDGESPELYITYRNTSSSSWPSSTGLYVRDLIGGDDGSVFRCSAWSSPNRVANVGSIAPNQSVTVRFKLCGDNQSAGSYQLGFQLAEGELQPWIEGPSAHVSFSVNVVEEHEATFVSQTAGTVELSQDGESQELHITYRNTGSSSWPSSTGLYVRDLIGGDDGSVFHCSAWPGLNRVANVGSVAPNQSVTVRFKLCGNSQSVGSYQLGFQLAKGELQPWIEGPNAHVSFDVEIKNGDIVWEYQEHGNDANGTENPLVLDEENGRTLVRVWFKSQQSYNPADLALFVMKPNDDDPNHILNYPFIEADAEAYGGSIFRDTSTWVPNAAGHHYQATERAWLEDCSNVPADYTTCNPNDGYHRYRLDVYLNSNNCSIEYSILQNNGTVPSEGRDGYIYTCYPTTPDLTFREDFHLAIKNTSGSGYSFIEHELAHVWWPIWIKPKYHDEVHQTEYEPLYTSVNKESWPTPANTDVLVFAAHSDDEALGAGGRIKEHLINNETVKVIIATFSDAEGQEYGRNRRRETIAAMQFLGLEKDDVFFLDYPEDSNLVNNNSFRDDVHRILDNYTPTKRIYVHSDHDSHLDHQAVYHAVYDEATALNLDVPLYTFIIHHGPEKAWPEPGCTACTNKFDRLKFNQGMTSPIESQPERLALPASFASTNKFELIRHYPSQMARSIDLDNYAPINYGYLGAFARTDELFWLLNLPSTGTVLGDCNSDTNVNAGDISTLVLEIFGGGSGNQSCDSNQDTEINAADISCTVLLIFNGPGACAAPPTP